MTRSAITFVILSAAVAAGCKQAVLCPPLDSCGGTIPVGDWVLAPNHPSCSEDLYTPAQDPRLVAAELPAARQPIPEPALYDWCSLLVTGPGTDVVVRAPRYYYESGEVGNATLHYDGASYTLATVRTGHFYLDFPAFCIRAFGATDENGVGVCKRMEPKLNDNAAMANFYRNITCDPNPNDPNGCVCQFDVFETESSKGAVLQTSADTLVHVPGNNFPQKVNFCLQGDRLQLTGADGSYLFDRLGLRTMDLVRVTTAPANP